MTKPEGISQSAWDEAREHFKAFSPLEDAFDAFNTMLITEAIAKAIMAATERAALIAEDHADTKIPASHAAYGYGIARAIRQGSQPSNAIPLKGVVR